VILSFAADPSNAVVNGKRSSNCEKETCLPLKHTLIGLYFFKKSPLARLYFKDPIVPSTVR
jgi:hypothetical protein